MSSYGAKMEKLHTLVSRLDEQYPNADVDTLLDQFRNELATRPDRQELEEAIAFWCFNQMVDDYREKMRLRQARGRHKRK
jgi:hypothetical protein